MKAFEEDNSVRNEFRGLGLPALDVSGEEFNVILYVAGISRAQMYSKMKPSRLDVASDIEYCTGLVLEDIAHEPRKFVCEGNMGDIL